MTENSEMSDYLPEEFWASSPILTQIKQAAGSRPCAPDAVLHALLARLAACTEPTVLVKLPFASDKPLCAYSGIFGNPGSGKGEAERLAAQLLPFPTEVKDGMATIKLATPEGLVQAYMRREETENFLTGETTTHMVQAFRRGYVQETEGSVFTAMSRKEDSKFNGVLCGMWMAEESGASLANEEKSRLLDKGTYTLGMSMSVQLEPAAQLLAMKSVGLPQRLAWAHARPAAEVSHEGVDVMAFTSLEEFAALMPEIESLRNGIDGDTDLASWVSSLRDVDVQPTLDMAKELYMLIFRRHERPELDVHEPLWKNRYTLLMALLHGETELSDLHWWQACVLWDTSRAVRGLVEREAERTETELRNTEAVNRAAAMATMQEVLTGVNPVVVGVAKAMWRQVKRNGEMELREVARKTIGGKQRRAYGEHDVSLVEAARLYAKEKRWLKLDGKVLKLDAEEPVDR